MLKKNLFESIVRFVKEFNYTSTGKNSSLTDYIVNHYRYCFHEQKPLPIQVGKPKFIEDMEDKEEQKRINEMMEKFMRGPTPDMFTSGGVTLKPSPIGPGLMCCVSHPRDSTNEQIIARYNELIHVTLSPRQLLSYMKALDHEFLTRFNKSPFKRDDKDRLSSWGGKLLYLSEIEDYIFIEEN